MKVTILSVNTLQLFTLASLRDEISDDCHSYNYYIKKSHLRWWSLASALFFLALR